MEAAQKRQTVAKVSRADTLFTAVIEKMNLSHRALPRTRHRSTRNTKIGSLAKFLEAALKRLTASTFKSANLSITIRKCLTPKPVHVSHR